MSKDINLVSSVNEELEAQERILKVLRIVAVSMLISIALVSVIAFIIQAAIPLAGIRQQESQTLSSLSALQKKMATYYLTKDRIGNIEKLIAERKDYSNPIKAILSSVTGTAQVSSIEIETNSISLSVSSSSLVDVNNFINSMFKLGQEGKVIKKVKFESLNLDTRNHTYSVSMTAEVL